MSSAWCSAGTFCFERERWDTMEDAVQAIGAVTQIYLDCLE